MQLSLWWTLVGAGVLISFTPGAGAVNTMANSLAAGWRRSLWGILGQQVALVVHVIIVALGVGVLVATNHWLFATIRLLGAGYLVCTATVVVIDILVMWLFFALAAKGLRRFMGDESGQRMLNRIFGSLFVVVGIMLAVLE